MVEDEEVLPGRTADTRLFINLFLHQFQHDIRSVRRLRFSFSGLI